MITVKTYRYDSPNNAINKTLTHETVYNGVLKEETSVLDPSFEISSSDDLSQVNYVWIDEFHRYYYVTNIVNITNVLWRFTCHVDVLMTYKPTILAHTAVIGRQQNLYNLYLNDGDTFKVLQKRQIIQKSFPSGFAGSDYVIIMAGDNEAPESVVGNGGD